MIAHIAADDGTRRGFLQELAARGADIRPGLRGWVDLIRDGRDIAQGRGFTRECDDGSVGQVRHFTGVAYACAVFGPRAVRAVSISLRGDCPDTPDGRLTDAAIHFATAIAEGSLTLSDVGDWVRRNICYSGAQ